MLSPSPPRLGELFSVWVTAKNLTTKNPVRQGNLRLDATMPAHRHGMTTLPRSRAFGDGRFHTVGCRFHMYGTWLFTVSLEAAGVSDHASFEYPFQPPSRAR